MKIQRIFNNTSTHSLDDFSLVLIDALIIEFMTQTTQSVNTEKNNKEVVA